MRSAAVSNSGAGGATGYATNRRVSLITIAPSSAPNRIRKRLGDDAFSAF
jgi:hypothetical protein